MFRRLLPVVLSLLILRAQATPPPPELVELQQTYTFLVAERVDTPHATGVEALNAKFLTALSTASEEARKAGKLPEVLAIEADKKLLEAGKPPPATDDDKTPESLKKLRGIYRGALEKLDQQRTAYHAALQPAYTAKLQALESTLTKANRLEEAKVVLAYREAVAAGLPPPAADGGYTNTLGMKFVPVRGTTVLFGIHEVRYQDYAAYAADAPNVNALWKDQKVDGFTPTDHPEQHPVWNVNWHEAREFCAWLSKKEGRTYRLPTDEEWSLAVGLGDAEKRTQDSTPATLSNVQNTLFPWGGDYPPATADKAGNYSDLSRKAMTPVTGGTYIETYDDGFPTTAPVMSFKPNPFGLYDLGGNVWEWCEDWFDASQKVKVLRGCAWGSEERRLMLSSRRGTGAPDFRFFYIGFRCVLVAP